MTWMVCTYCTHKYNVEDPGGMCPGCGRFQPPPHRVYSRPKTKEGQFSAYTDYLGCVYPPDELLADSRAADPLFWHSVLTVLWKEWWSKGGPDYVWNPACPNGHFLDWLTEARGWRYADTQTRIVLDTP